MRFFCIHFSTIDKNAFAVVGGIKPRSHIHNFGPGRATVHHDLAGR